MCVCVCVCVCVGVVVVVVVFILKMLRQVSKIKKTYFKGKQFYTVKYRVFQYYKYLTNVKQFEILFVYFGTN